jgi:hypothetical protein
MVKLKRDMPPREGCAGYKDYFGEFDCEYEPPFPCEECMYCEWNKQQNSKGNIYRGKNPQAKKWNNYGEIQSCRIKATQDCKR